MAFITADQGATTTAIMVWDKMFMVYGIPEKSFDNYLLKELCALANVEKIRTTAAHPQGNRQVERMNGVLIQIICKMEHKEVLCIYGDDMLSLSVH